MSLRLLAAALGAALILCACTAENPDPNRGASATSGGASGTPAGETPAPTKPPKPEEPIYGEGVAAIKRFIEEEKAAGRIDTSKEGWKTSLPRFPRVTFKKGAELYWVLEIKTEEERVDKIVVKLLPDLAPNHVANCIYLNELGFYDGLTFHRIIPFFMAQGGCPNGNGMGNPGYQFGGEFPADGRKVIKHMIAAANTPQPDTDGSQFFIAFAEAKHLDGKHTVYGEIVDGKGPAQRLANYGSPSGAIRTVDGKAWPTPTIVKGSISTTKP